MRPDRGRVAVLVGLLCLLGVLGAGVSACGPEEGQDRTSASSSPSRSASAVPTPKGPVGYREAREIVVAKLANAWENGTFCLDDRKIMENDEMFVFEVGAKEYIVDGDPDFQAVGGVPAVRKSDGTLRWLSSAEVATDDSMRTKPNPSPTKPLCG